MIDKYSINSYDSQIAIGSHINQVQMNNSDVFYDLCEIIREKIKDENDKQYFLNIIKQLEDNRNNKKKFKELYDNFIIKIGTYMSIFSPFLPLLVKYLPQ